MITYQDFLKVGDDDNKRMDFVQTAIHAHKNSDAYKEAIIAQDYKIRHNTTIVNFQKLLYTISGVAVPDNFSANYKLCSNFFSRFVTQLNQYLLGNGVSLADSNQKAKLSKDFDTRLQEIGKQTLVDGEGFGFWNYDHLEVFRLTQFVPLYDEENGGLACGIRFWQIDSARPLRATLYELDGYTEYIWREGKGEIYKPKRAYILRTRTSVSDGTEILDGMNYPSLPIVPMWANDAHQSEIVGLRENIDAYDLIKSGFCNNVDEASYVYWTIQNAGGMDDIDLAKFLERMRTIKAATIEDDGAQAESHSLDVPYQSRETLLIRLRSDMYEDQMALDTKNIANGAITATQILAAYDPLGNRGDEYEYHVRDFLDKIFALAGIDSEYSFTRSMIVNSQEMIQTLIQAAPSLSSKYVTRKILELLGDGDKAEEVLAQMAGEELSRLGELGDETDEDTI